MLVVAVLLLGGGFYLGARYSETKSTAANKEATEISQITPKPTPKEDLEERCGKLPGEAYPNFIRTRIEV